MKREASEKINWQANEAKGFDTVLIRVEAESGLGYGCSVQKCFRMKTPANVGA
jgi:hypothetical protein